MVSLPARRKASGCAVEHAATRTPILSCGVNVIESFTLAGRLSTTMKTGAIRYRSTGDNGVDQVGRITYFPVKEDRTPWSIGYTAAH